jgi:uncharacterized Fe-S cluster protein YjdI/CDGSH-type Zn-finger protein
MKRYTAPAITVTFDPARCLHAAECLRGLPAVFDVKRRPWITPDAAAPEDVAEVVRRCPSGALHYESGDVEAEKPERPTAVGAEPGGPLWLRGDLRLGTQDGELADVRAGLCRCGDTANAPFCDGSGPCTDWHQTDEPVYRRLCAHRAVVDLPTSDRIQETP